MDIETDNTKIILINTNSLVSYKKRYELAFFLNKHNPNIVLLNETNLVTRHKLAFKNYKIIRTDKTNSRGTAILIRDNIKYNIINISQLAKLEATAISIETDKNKILIASIYRSPSSGYMKITEDMNKIIHYAKTNKLDIVLGGDFNCHHTLLGANIDTKEGTELIEWINDNSDIGIKALTSLYPSRPNKNGGSFIDIFLISNNIKVKFKDGFSNKLETTNYESDHEAVILNIMLSKIENKEKNYF